MEVWCGLSDKIQTPAGESDHVLQRPPDMEDSCEYNEKQSRTADKGWSVSLGDWVRDLQVLTIKN
jgi:hypothetical protein